VNAGVGIDQIRSQLKKLEVRWSIEGENAQFHNQWLKWNRQSTLGLTIEFNRGEIAWN
jgi:hypothetical protein